MEIHILTCLMGQTTRIVVSVGITCCRPITATSSFGDIMNDVEDTDHA